MKRNAAYELCGGVRYGEIAAGHYLFANGKEETEWL